MCFRKISFWRPTFYFGFLENVGSFFSHFFTVKNCKNWMLLFKCIHIESSLIENNTLKKQLIWRLYKIDILEALNKINLIFWLHLISVFYAFKPFVGVCNALNTSMTCVVGCYPVPRKGSYTRRQASCNSALSPASSASSYDS